MDKYLPFPEGNILYIAHFYFLYLFCLKFIHKHSSELFYADTVSVIVQCAFRSAGLLMELLYYYTYSIGIIPETFLD